MPMEPPRRSQRISVLPVCDYSIYNPANLRYDDLEPSTDDPPSGNSSSMPSQSLETQRIGGTSESQEPVVVDLLSDSASESNDEQRIEADPIHDVRLEGEGARRAQTSLATSTGYDSSAYRRKPHRRKHVVQNSVSPLSQSPGAKAHQPAVARRTLHPRDPNAGAQKRFRRPISSPTEPPKRHKALDIFDQAPEKASSRDVLRIYKDSKERRSDIEPITQELHELRRVLDDHVELHATQALSLQSQGTRLATLENDTRTLLADVMETKDLRRQLDQAKDRIGDLKRSLKRTTRERNEAVAKAREASEERDALISRYVGERDKANRERDEAITYLKALEPATAAPEPIPSQPPSQNHANGVSSGREHSSAQKEQHSGHDWVQDTSVASQSRSMGERSEAMFGRVNTAATPDSSTTGRPLNTTSGRADVRGEGTGKGSGRFKPVY